MKKMFLNDIKEGKVYLIISIFFTIGAVFSTIYIPVLIGDMIDEYTVDGLVDDVVKKIVFMVLLALLYAIFKYLSEYFSQRASVKIANKMRKNAYEKALTIQTVDQTSFSSGQYLDFIIVSIDRIKEGLSQSVNQLVFGVLSILGIMVMMFSKNVILAFVVVLLTPVSMIVSYWIAKRTFKSLQVSLEKKAELTSYTSEMISQYDEVNNMFYQEKAVKKYQEKNDQFYQTGVKALLYQSYINPTTRVINLIIYLLTALVGGIMLMNNNRMSIGVFSIFLSYAFQYTKPFNEISATMQSLQELMASYKRLFNLLSKSKEVDASHEKVDIRGDVEIKHLDFSYGSNIILADLNLKIKKGERVAIVGATGSGKTTIIKLLLGLYEVSPQTIFFNQIPIENISKEILRSQIGVVLQDASLFKTTILKNLSYGNQSSDINHIKHVCQLIGADDFILRLKDGYDTIITDDQMLSKGEIQLINIARIIIKNADIVILDEATANVDAQTDLKIQHALRVLMEGKTTIVIAHRLKTIQDSDQIIVLDHGIIVEKGSHDALILRNGVYKRLYFTQKQ